MQIQVPDPDTLIRMVSSAGMRMSLSAKLQTSYFLASLPVVMALWLLLKHVSYFTGRALSVVQDMKHRPWEEQNPPYRDDPSSGSSAVSRMVTFVHICTHFWASRDRISISCDCSYISLNVRNVTWKFAGATSLWDSQLTHKSVNLSLFLLMLKERLKSFSW